MKLICFRYPRNKVTDILLSLICIFVIVLILQNGKTYVQVNVDSNESSIVSFILEHGWYVDTEKVSVSQKMIPVVFDETYNEYNRLQQEQGFDLELYKGKSVLLYSFPLLNYPEYENYDNIFINILTFDDIIIGADICNISINGFITGVIKNEQSPT